MALVILHIAAGSVAFVAAPVAMYARKGRRGVGAQAES